MRHLLSIEDLDREAIERILDRAAAFAEVSDREIKKVPALRGRTVLNLFYEASTRTRSSFELAAKRLSADVVNFAASGSSVEKGESLKDTVLTLERPLARRDRHPHAVRRSGGARRPVDDGGDRQRRRRQARAPDPGAARRPHAAPEARLPRGPFDLDRRRRRALARRALEHPRLPHDGRPRDRLRAADADAARHRGARLRRALRPRRPARGRRRLRAAHAARAHGRGLRAEPARVRRLLPDQRPPAGPAPGAHAPRPGQPRRRAVRRGRRLAAGGHHDAGRGRGRRPDGRPLRAARRRARRDHAPRPTEPQLA